MKNKIKNIINYTIIVFILTFLVTFIINLTSTEQNLYSMAMFALANLIPMIVAIIFINRQEKISVKKIIKNLFLTKEQILPFILIFIFLVIYFGLSYIIGNAYLKTPFLQALIYLPLSLLFGGLEEVGWRGYIQDKVLKSSNIFISFIIISIIWACWHIPIYSINWVNTGSTIWYLFYIMILGNTFTLGTIKMFTKGIWLCVLYHMLLDTLSGWIAIQGNAILLLIMVLIEIIVSSTIIMLYKTKGLSVVE